MDFISNISGSPFMTAIAASVIALLYFFLMTFSPNLPPALLFSAVIGYFVYALRSGTVGNHTPQQQQLPKVAPDTETNDDHVQRQQMAAPVPAPQPQLIR